MKSFELKSLGLLLALLIACAPVDALAQKKKKKGKKAPPITAKKDKDAIKSMKTMTKKHKVSEGLFPVYQDSTSGATYLLVTKDQLDQDFLYFSQIADGVVDAGYFRGSYQSSQIFSFERHFKSIQIRLKNIHYEFDPESELSRASKANINEPIILTEKIVAANKDMDSLLISANSLLMGEGISQIKFPPPPGLSRRIFSIGDLNKNSSKILSINNYPENTSVRTEYVFTKKYPSNGGSAAVTDARSVSIKYDHSFIALPEIPMESRIEDPRVGYFSTTVTNMTTTDVVPWRDRIHRWRLEKKDPEAALSEPVKPITWWIENTTPADMRPAIREGVEAWNKAFEKAGFKNAVVVKVQPDDADWDAGDIRYNVLRWTSSPRPPFGGYGPSFVDPRTGEILGADIMLEYTFITNRIREYDLFENSGMGWLKEENNTNEHFGHQCQFTSDLQDNLLFGSEVLDAMELPAEEHDTFLKEALMELCLHEVGHTLGLNHNMKASSIYSLEQLADKELMRAQGPTGSVMDYAPSNLPWVKGDDVQYFHVVPGPYDNWAIEFGYTPVKNEGELKTILAKSTDPLLVFGNDADDMRSSARGIDPRVMIYDMSSDPVAHAIKTIDQAEGLLGTIKDRYGKGDRSYQELLRSYSVLTGRQAGALNVMTRQIGGIYMDRSFADQKTENKPFVPVPEAKQKAAMKALIKYGFAPDAFSSGKTLLDYLQPQRRGFNAFARNQDPMFHDRVLFAQGRALNHLLHRNTMRRLVDSELYGNTYTLAEMMTELTDGIFRADNGKKVNTVRQNLQDLYVDALIRITNEDSGHRTHSISMAMYELKRIQRWMQVGGPDTLTKAHRLNQANKIKVALEGKK